MTIPASESAISEKVRQGRRHYHRCGRAFSPLAANAIKMLSLRSQASYLNYLK